MKELFDICMHLENLTKEVRGCLMEETRDEYRCVLEKTLLRLHKTLSELNQKIYLS